MRLEGFVTSQGNESTINSIRDLLFGDEPPARITEALRVLPAGLVAELHGKLRRLKELRDRKVRPWGPPAWIVGHRAEWVLRLLDEAEEVGIAQALASAPEIPPLGPWDEFRDLAVSLLFSDSPAHVKELLAADARTRQPELYDMVSYMERDSDPATPEPAFIKARAKWLLWVLQRDQQAGLEQAIAESPPFPGESPSRHWSLLPEPAAGLLHAYDRSGDTRHLEELTAYLRGTTAAESSLGAGVALQHAGARWSERYGQAHQPADFATAAALLGNAIDSFPPRHVGAARSRYLLAELHRLRWRQAENPRDADEITRLLAQAAADLPADDMFWPGCMPLLGNMLLLRYETEGDTAVLAEAVEVADRICNEQRANLDTWLMGVSLRVRAQFAELKSGTPAEPRVPAVLGLVHEAVEQAEADVTGAGLPGRLAEIGGPCWEVGQWAGDSEFVAAAAEVSRAVLRLLPRGGEEWWSEAIQLSATLVALSQGNPDPAYPDEALALLDVVQSESPPTWDSRLELLQTQAEAAGMKFTMTADPRWAQSGLGTAREALSLARQQGRGVLACLVTAARQLLSVHESTGSPAALDEAISLLPEATSIAPEDKKGLAFNLLGMTLTRRFGLRADIQDIDAAISALETAARAPGRATHPRHHALQNLSFALVVKSTRTKDPALLDRAIGCLEEAEQHLSGADRAFLLAKLAGTHTERFRYSEDLADLDRCVELCEEVFRYSGHLHRRTMFSALGAYGNALRRRYRSAGQAADLDRAIEALERALPEARGDNVNAPSHLRDLALAYQARYQLAGADDDLRRGSALYKESIESAAALDPSTALESALLLGRWAETRGDWPEAAEAFQTALQAITRLVATQALRGHKESWLEEARMLPARAAYALARCGRHDEAVLALENGQALLLSEALEQGAVSGDRLRTQGHGDMADRYLRAQARFSAMQAAGQALPDAASAAFAAGPEQLNSELGDLLDEVITLSGRLIAPVTLAEIAEAAAERPLVYVIYGRQDGAALLVDNSAKVRHIPLPLLTATALREKHLAFFEAHQHRGPRPANWLSAIDEISRWLWAALMEPVIAQGHPAVAMIPTGALWLLPLHLAWRPADSSTGRRYALDDLLLTFAPNARVLNRRAGTEVRSILMVENPESAIAAPLSYARYEAKGALRHFADDQQELLRGPEATRTKVLAALGSHDCLHFACHGRAEPGRPLDSALLLSDARLTLRDIVTVKTAARVVVLSACETAVIGTALPDEVVGLPVGFLQAGAAGVIGSLWEVPDRTTATLMTRFYQFWRSQNEPPAQALRHAQQQVRDEIAQDYGQENAHPYLWGAFTYIGK